MGEQANPASQSSDPQPAAGNAAPTREQHDRPERSDGGSILAFVEDIINGVVSFVVGFIGLGITFLLRPRKVLVQFEKDGDRSGWPGAYTYIAVALFLFFLMWQDETLDILDTMDAQKLEGISLSTIEKTISEFKVERFFVTTLPSTVLVIMLGSLLARLAGDRDPRRRELAPRVTAYAIGSQIVAGLLFMLMIALAATFMIDEGWTLYVFGGTVAIGMIYLIIMPGLTLSRWFSKTENLNGIMRPAVLRFPVIVGLTFALNISFFVLLTYMDTNESGATVKVVRWNEQETDDGYRVQATFAVHNFGTTRYFVAGSGNIEVDFYASDAYDVVNEVPSGEGTTLVEWVELAHGGGLKSTRVDPGEMALIEGTFTLPKDQYDPWDGHVHQARVSLTSIAMEDNGNVTETQIAGSTRRANRQDWPIGTTAGDE